MSEVIYPNVIYEDRARNILLQCSYCSSPEMVALLERTIWGMHGMRYMKENVLDSLDKIRMPYFLSLTVEDELVAAAVRARKRVRVGTKCYDAFHLANLAVDAPHMGRGYGKLLTGQSKIHFLNRLDPPGILYGYIEAGNARSLRINQKAGFRSIGLLRMISFSHLWPQDDARVEQAQASDRETILQLLNEQYADHALLDFEESLDIDNYYVLRQGHEILAGVQAEQLHFSIKHLPGFGGAFLINVLAHVPILHRLFPTGEYHFLRFGNLYIREGDEAKIFTLTQALLARRQLNSGVAMMDERSAIFQRMATTKEFSVLNALTKVKMQLIATFKGVSEAEIEEFCHRPVHVSPADIV